MVQRGCGIQPGVVGAPMKPMPVASYRTLLGSQCWARDPFQQTIGSQGRVPLNPGPKYEPEYWPEQLPVAFRRQLEVSDTIAILGIWDHNIGNYPGPYVATSGIWDHNIDNCSGPYSTCRLTP